MPMPKQVALDIEHKTAHLNLSSIPGGPLWICNKRTRLIQTKDPPNIAPCYLGLVRVVCDTRTVSLQPLFQQDYIKSRIKLVRG
jgi:hypothetical protein